MSIDYNKQDAANWVQVNDYPFTEWGWDGGSNPILNQFNDYCDDSLTVPQSYIIDADRNCRYVFTDTIGFVTAVTKVVDELI